MMEKEFGIDLSDAYLLLSVGPWFIMFVLDKINSNVVGFDIRGGAESVMITWAKKKMIK